MGGFNFQILFLIVLLCLSIGQCFFGYRLYSLWSRFIGFFTGALLLMSIGRLCGWESTVTTCVGVGAGIIVSIVAVLISKAGVFIGTLFNSFCFLYLNILSIMIFINPETNGFLNLIPLIVISLVSVAAAVLSLFWSKPFVVISTAISGGTVTSCIISQYLGFSLYTQLIFVAISAILGIMVQIRMTGGFLND